MFLTRAAQIIGKEGFKTFGYALQQKMHQNMTDAKVYGIYQKKIAPKQRITDNKADCTAICRHSGSYESMLAAVFGMDADANLFGANFPTKDKPIGDKQSSPIV